MVPPEPAVHDPEPPYAPLMVPPVPRVHWAVPPRPPMAAPDPPAETAAPPYAPVAAPPVPYVHWALPPYAPVAPPVPPPPHAEPPYLPDLTQAPADVERDTVTRQLVATTRHPVRVIPSSSGTPPLRRAQPKLDLLGVGRLLEREPIRGQLGLQVPVRELDQEAWEIRDAPICHPQAAR